MKRVQVALTLCALLILAGCIHKTGSAVTPWERIMTDNALLAQFADTAEQGTELAVTSGLLSTANARPVITFEGQFAGTHQQITAILAQGQGVASLADVTALLNTIKTQGALLIATGEVGVKNPKTQQTIGADLNNIISMAEAILSDIQLYQAGGGQ